MVTSLIPTLPLSTKNARPALLALIVWPLPSMVMVWTPVTSDHWQRPGEGEVAGDVDDVIVVGNAVPDELVGDPKDVAAQVGV
jgi:hypothetical protein